MIARARAPLRVALAGGGTDVPPYTKERIGAVLNFTIDKYVTTTIEPCKETYIEARSYGLGAPYSCCDKGPLMLIATVLDYFSEKYAKEAGESPIKIIVDSDAPPGSGIGSSSTVCVSVLGALHEYYGIPVNKYDIAVDAYKLERIVLGMAGGSQDQFAASFGGFNYMEFGYGSEHADGTRIYPLRLSTSVIKELGVNFLLVDTGISHDSGAIINKQTDIYRNDKAMRMVYEKSAKYPASMVDTLIKGNLDRLYYLINRAHENKRKFCDLIENDIVKTVRKLSLNNGAKACRILGAGGGGHMLIVVDPGDRKGLIEILYPIAKPVDFSFDFDGLHTWRRETRT
jgi:D-glycero-alpha-D-manno-heptose-7-phosphate kinase